MLRHGLLSPHSKLLPEANTQQPSSQPGGWASGEYNECWIQYVWDDNKVGTIQRSTGYASKTIFIIGDGRQLRAGMELTTGLGWSDRCTISTNPPPINPKSHQPILHNRPCGHHPSTLWLDYTQTTVLQRTKRRKTIKTLWDRREDPPLLHGGNDRRVGVGVGVGERALVASGCFPP
ncbi:hypothetical protein PILCRDRAFT_757232 [Piloderma croceum F 1598]|uniref:Uncharacterized protein n=1 Tax=Piloderma croceum (strain F 1598) TaxID=765440 RepID=A0A0C3EU16_PILCF|nr:hypothetical protein PILCRDRAFT_757232 [Piloderma croceum F 1598]